MNYDKWLIWISVILGLVTIWSGLKQHKITTSRTAMSPFLEKQLEAYLEITGITAKLATTSDRTTFDSKKEEFWSFYFGKLVVLEDNSVESAMVKYGELLKITNFEDELNRDKLKQASMRVAQSCRLSIAKSWKIDLAPLEQNLVYGVF